MYPPIRGGKESLQCIGCIYGYSYMLFPYWEIDETYSYILPFIGKVEECYYYTHIGECCSPFGVACGELSTDSTLTSVERSTRSCALA